MVSPRALLGMLPSWAFKKRYLFLVQLSVLLFIAGYLTWGYRYDRELITWQSGGWLTKDPDLDTMDEAEREALRFKVAERVRVYHTAIMNPKDNSLRRMRCPQFPAKRFKHLRAPANLGNKKLYFFALNLKQCHYILPRLMGSIVEVIRFLGPKNVVLSIVEGHSTDGTSEVLHSLRDSLEALGVVYFYKRSDIDPHEGERIARLAELRNQALEPLYNSRQSSAAAASSSSSSSSSLSSTGLEFTDDATIAFINDVAICPDDILELLHQRKNQQADMTCGMDWSWPLQHHPFYDVWVARQLNGGSFFDVDPVTGNWVRPWELFPRDPASAARYKAGRPVQVFSCWNGGVTMTAAPFLSGEVRFRDGNPGECRMGEPTYLNKDLWFKGHGRFAIVPSVNVAYDDETGAAVKRKYGYVTDLARSEGSSKLPLQIPWQKDPPEKILCMPGWTSQSWVPWNETLV